MEAEAKVSHDHLAKFQIDILTLLKDGVLSGDDLIEDYVEIYSSLREKLIQASNSAEIPAGLYGRFLKDWHRRMKVARNEWVALLVPRALFSLAWGYERSAAVLGLSQSKVRFLALQAIQEKIGKFPVQIGKGCARNDLYLTDVLMGQSWTDTLKIYRPSDFKSHRESCLRCAEIFKKSVVVVNEWKEGVVRAVPAEIDMILKSQPQSYGSGVLAQYHRLGWFNKLSIQIMGSAIVLAAVLLVPFYQKIDVGALFRRTSIDLTQTREHLPEADEPVTTDYSETAQTRPDDIEDPPLVAKTDEVPTTVVAKADVPMATQLVETPPKPEPKVEKTPEVKPVEKVPLVLTRILPLRHPDDRVAVNKTPEVKTTPAKVDTPTTATTVPVSTATVVAATTAAKTPDVTKPNTSGENPSVGGTQTAANGKRYFYRWGARSDDPDLVASTIMKILSKHSAMKAGDLELGAEYKGGRYFHFNIDQTLYENVAMEIRDVHLKDFTATRSESDRVDDAGKIRIVFWVGPTKL